MEITPTDLTISSTIARAPTRPRACWQRVALAVVLLLATILHFWGLDREGLNLYYAATVKSMLTSWHTFFFASFDPGGFVTVDKPPLGLWIQAASALIFGFSGWSLLLPQALAGVLSVALLYHIVGRIFGATAGILAALILAVTPISIAANRNNTMDSQLVLTSLIAAWMVSLAVERGRLRWLLLCAIFVGIGFNIKMLQAVMVLPAFWFVYLVAARTAWWKRIIHLSLATVVLAIVSLVWVVIVDLTPADQRPFVGSSRNNSETELIIGHNGLARLGMIANWLGLRGAPPPGQRAQPPPPPPNPPFPPPGQQPPPRGQPPPGNPPPGQPGQPPRGQFPQGNPPAGQPGQPGQPQPPRGPNDETGEPGILRLFNKQLAGQISWLLPLSALGFLAAAFAARLTYPLTREHQQLILWGMWLAPQVVFFSFAGLFHRYYLEMLSPAIAALVGIGFVALWNTYTQHRWRGMILPIAILIGAATEIAILSQFADWAGWLVPVLVGASIVVAIGLVIRRIVDKSAIRILQSAAVTIGILILLIAPTIWSFTSVIGSGDIGLPFAGPELLSRPRRTNVTSDTRWTDYLLANRNGARFIAATLNANSAAPIILATAQPVMALGGFSGGDKIVSLDQLKAFVADNTVRYFWLTQQNNPVELSRWVTSSCTNITNSIRPGLPTNRSQPAPNPSGDQQLYDCGLKR